MEDKLIETISYRDGNYEIYLEDLGQQYYTIIENEKISFGQYNTEYKKDLEYLVDKRLDTLYRYSGEYTGAVIEYFNNAGYRDIRLCYKGRLLKVYPLSTNSSKLNKDQINVDWLKADGENILKFYIYY